MSGSDSSLLDPAHTPAMRPPPGVTHNFVNPYSQGPILDVMGPIMIAPMMILVSIRFYTKAFILRKAWWDDCS